MTIPVSAPELHRRMKPVLARGTKLPLAVEGFASAEQFATLAHAARNTQVPFILLKHRVLTEGQSLEAAIQCVEARTRCARGSESRAHRGEVGHRGALDQLRRGLEQLRLASAVQTKGPGNEPWGPFCLYRSLEANRLNARG